MAYKVIGAAAVAEMDDGKPELGTGKKLYFDEGVQLPDGVKEKSIEHLVSIGLVEEVSDKPAEFDEAGNLKSSRSRGSAKSES